MRSIKFRIWDKNKNEWLGASDDNSLEWYGFHLVGECMTVQAPPHWALDNGIVEQYTGLKDKNGEEIYEGDIVANGTLTGVVEYKVDDFCAWTVGATTNGIVLLSGSWTVIGNVHESNMEELCPRE